MCGGLLGEERKKQLLLIVDSGQGNGEIIKVEGGFRGEVGSLNGQADKDSGPGGSVIR
jgi:hypothetical protein